MTAIAMQNSGTTKLVLLVSLLASAFLSAAGNGAIPPRRNLIIDTDLFSDVDDAGAIMLAATSPSVRLLAVNVNHPSSYSVLAASALLAHYGHPQTPVGARRPLTASAFFDSWFFELGEYASKVAYRWSGGTLPWGHAENAWDPVALYRKVLSEAPDQSVTIASIGFFENLSGLLNSSADIYSALSGPELIAAKVSELVVMGGEYPSGYEFNFWGDNSSLAAHVVNEWKGPIVFSGFELGANVKSGGPLMAEGPENDPVRAAYIYYTYNTSRASWDPLTVLYAMGGLGELFEYGNANGYNHVAANGSNSWVFDDAIRNQHWLRLRVAEETAAAELDRLFLKGAWSEPDQVASMESGHFDQHFASLPRDRLAAT
ncbi:inosine/uridine-preferring nucleoside hydrolase [Lasiosphaeria ovina]|uniref:Inosine/uridine-preferring nucleoside hydrolase n=1 Tax=Lasiosphaeria ovina TaxID=92902 RepID=A0AAE0TUW8_9PEZI|nr:inosine/uridine-preferring nucleoside hydrolase [Lasiosphaeria ovina]